MTRERLGGPVVVGDITITPIERTSVSERALGPVVVVFGSKRPVAILVESPGRSFRIDLPDPEADADPGDGARD